MVFSRLVGVAVLLITVIVGAPSAWSAAPPDRWGLGIGGQHSISDGFGDRPSLELDALWRYTGPISLRAFVRGIGPISVSSMAVGIKQASPVATAYGASVGAQWLVGFEGPSLRAALGVGMAYHMRFAKTIAEGADVMMPDEAPGASTMEYLDINDHPGIETSLELGWRALDQVWFGILAGYSYAALSVYVRERAESDFFIGHPGHLSSINAMLFVRMVR